MRGGALIVAAVGLLALLALLVLFCCCYAFGHVLLLRVLNSAIFFG